MSWGFKFEQYMLSDEPGQSPDTTQPVDEGEEFACVFSTKLGDHNLLYVAEMDGVLAKEELQEPIDWAKQEFVELKTSLRPENHNQRRNFQQKILKWWCQSFLVGIDKIYCGFRDNHGIVSEVKSYKLKELVDMSKVSKIVFKSSAT